MSRSTTPFFRCTVHLMMITQKRVKKMFIVILSKVLPLVLNAKGNFTLMQMEAKRCICHYIAELINDFYG